jgi:starch phosphorylase
MHGFSDGKSYSDVISSMLYGGDPYMVISDFRRYADTQERLYMCISDPSEMGRLSLMNIAKSGYFAADRAIDEYARNIWHIK